MFSNDDLTIHGNGSLTVEANDHHGIASHNDQDPRGADHGERGEWRSQGQGLDLCPGRRDCRERAVGASGNDHFYLNGGTVYVDAMGDGLDVNGSIDMTGGIVLVNGPTANNNGALDYGGTFIISGGLLVAVGSAGMAQAPSLSSTQYSVAYTFASVQAAGTIVHLETEAGVETATFVPTKATSRSWSPRPI